MSSTWIQSYRGTCRISLYFLQWPNFHKSWWNIWKFGTKSSKIFSNGSDMVPTDRSGSPLLMGLDISKRNMFFSRKEILRTHSIGWELWSKPYCIKRLEIGFKNSVQWTDIRKKFEKWGKCWEQLGLPWGGWISPQEGVSVQRSSATCTTVKRSARHWNTGYNQHCTIRPSGTVYTMQHNNGPNGRARAQHKLCNAVPRLCKPTPREKLWIRRLGQLSSKSSAQIVVPNMCRLIPSWSVSLHLPRNLPNLPPHCYSFSQMPPL